MACRYVRNKDNEIVSALASNGESSLLFDSLLNASGNIDIARTNYERLYTKEAKEMYGVDFENFEESKDLFVTDKNGEPILAAGDGMYYIITPKGQQIQLTDLKLTQRQTSSNLSYEQERQIVDTAISFVNDLISRNPTYFKGKGSTQRVKNFFNEQPDGSKGVLAERMLAESFQGLGFKYADRQKAIELFNIGKERGRDAMLDSLPEGVAFKPGIGDVFFNIYNNWSDVSDAKTGNLLRKGWRSTILEGFEAYGMRVRDDVGEILDIDDTPIRIHDISRLEENPKDKLSAVVKSFLTDIRSDESLYSSYLKRHLVDNNLTEKEFFDGMESGEIIPPAWHVDLKPNDLGYYTAIPLDVIYSDINEAGVNQDTFVGQLTELNTMAKYKPYLVPVVTKLRQLNARQQAAFYSNFANSYKNFLQFRNRTFDDVQDGQKVGTKTEVQMFPSDRGSIARRSASGWRRQSTQGELPNPRALYNVAEDGTMTPIESKVNAINKAWEKIDKLSRVSAESGYILKDQDVKNLNDYLWNMGIQYGNTIEQSEINLKRYFEVGNSQKLEGYRLFRNMVFEQENRQLKRLKDDINNGKNIYDSSKEIIKDLAVVSSYFGTKAAESFLSGTGKTYYPINMPTPLDDLITHIKSENFGKTVKQLQNTLLFNPAQVEDPKNRFRSKLLNLLTREEVVRELKVEILDSSKLDKSRAADDYESQNTRVSLIVRLNAFANNGSKNFTKIATSTEADRKRLGFVTLPRVGGKYISDPNQVIKSIIVQDLAVRAQARQEVKDALDSNDFSKLIKGYHYLNNPSAFDGPVFNYPQIEGLNYDVEVAGMPLETHMTTYLSGESNNNAQINEALNNLVEEVNKKIDKYAERMKTEMRRVKVNPQALHPSIRKPNAVRDFVLNDVILRAEFKKLTRGGMTFAKKPTDYYKRMKGINTPGKKLLIKGDALGNTEYGMMPTYNSITIAPFGFEFADIAAQIGENMYNNLEGLVTDETRAKLRDAYSNIETKADGQSYISLDMYRGIMEGIGEWGRLDTQAFDNHNSTDPNNPYAGRYVDNKGNARPIYPVKPYAEEFTVRNGIPVLSMDKNSYVVVTKELSAEYPQLEKLRSAMESQGIHVAHEENANKGGRKDVRDIYTDSLDNLNPMVMDSRKLRLPQLYNTPSKDTITFSRQIRKNIISNWNSSPEIFREYQNLISENIAEDTAKIEKELGINKLRNAKTNEERAEAKLQYLKNLRDKLVEAVKDKGYPDTYLGALDIVPNGPYDYRFAVPLSFPNYQSRFEQIFFSLLSNRIFKQKQKGKDLVQIAELGGHETSTELTMFDGTTPAQVMMRRSDLGIEENENIEDLIANDDLRLKVIGYRIPNQGKNSMLPAKVIRFLPESHNKGIIVPGAVTVQMGSDFDVDKMIIIQREEGDSNRKKRDQRIFDIMYDSLMDRVHLAEVLDPLDGARIDNKAAELREAKGDTRIDYNDPLAELDMEMRNKAGIRLRGSWANILAGHNVSQAGNLTVVSDNAPIIEGVTFNKLGAKFEFDFNTGQASDKYNSASISAYLSAAVDAANKPIQIDINDNEFTVPVAGMMLSAGIPVEVVIDFLTQPAILEIIQDARDNGFHMGQLYKSIQTVRKKYKTADSRTPAKSTENMTLEELATKDSSSQLKMIDNFNLMYKAGMSVTRAFKVITPDNLDNVNEMAAVNAWLDVERQYTTDTNMNLIEGAEEFITELKDGGESIYPIQVAYRGIFNTMLTAAEEAGFINNRPAFFQFKRNLMFDTHQNRYTRDQHKFIDRAIFLDLLSHPDNPLSSLMSKENFERLYVDKNNNIAIRLNKLQDKPELARNSFFTKLVQSDTNNQADSIVFTIELDSSYDMGVLEKNKMTEDFRKMLTSKDPEVVQFAKDLIANQLMTSGFHPQRGSYIDLIPSEVYTTSMLNPGLEPPVVVFNRQQTMTLDRNYLNRFVHKFVRNYGTAAPGGTPFLPTIRNIDTTKETVSIVKEMNPGIYKKNGGFVGYFVTYPPGGDPVVYVRLNDNVYQKLQMMGTRGKLNEVGNTTKESAINKEGTIALPGPNTSAPLNMDPEVLPESVTEPLEIKKVCKIS